MFWKVAGFSQPSPVEQILDKEEFTLEELLDEDDIIQECKSLNGRLVAFLRERSTVEQLIRYLVEPPLDTDDPKRTYKYPFTACEVFSCEVEAVFNTLLEDADLMKLLFSLLDSPAPLSCKTAGYFGRVVGNLLLRKTSEMMQYLQDNPHLLQKLVDHVDTTSVADIIKRLVGADEPTSLLFIPHYAQWLSETPLVDLLLARLSEGSSAEAQANSADILSAIAHTQPSPLAAKLTTNESVSALFTHAMAQSQQVLVPALDVCIALLEPRRSMTESLAETAPFQEAAARSKIEAANAIVQHVPKLVQVLQAAELAHTQETPFGLLAPPLGRARLKIAELLAVLLRSGNSDAEAVLMQSGALSLSLQLFAKYPFNNLLHHCVTAMLVAALTKCSEAMLQHLFEDCKLLDWLVALPVEIRPTPRPGQEEAAAAKAPIRAGYLGHVTQIASTLESFSVQTSSSSSEVVDSHPQASVANFLDRHPGWQEYVEEVLHPRQQLENTARWACGRPAATDLAGLDSDGDEYQGDMDLEQMPLISPALYHRYNVVDEGDEDDDDEGGDPFMSNPLIQAVSGLDLNDAHGAEETSSDDMDREMSHASASHNEAQQVGAGMDDDEVLLATSDDDEILSDAAADATSPLAAGMLPSGPDDTASALDEATLGASSELSTSASEQERVREQEQQAEDQTEAQSNDYQQEGPVDQEKQQEQQDAANGSVKDISKQVSEVGYWKPTYSIDVEEEAVQEDGS